jgi:small subunit ribosomal protein S20
MANHASAEKRNRQRIRRTERNRSIKGAVRTLLKKARAALSAPGTKTGDSAAAVAAAIKAVDRAASKGVVHAKMAARAKSRLARAAHKQVKTASA